MKAETVFLKEEESGKSMMKLVKDFFNPAATWGRQNRSQLIIGLISAAVYFITNIFFNSSHPDWNPFTNSSNGLLMASFICIGFTGYKFVTGFLNTESSKYPWYERYLPVIITLLGLITLMAFQNLGSVGTDDAGLLINIILLLILFIIAAGYFVEGKSNEKVLKIWFALLGYFFSIIAFFYFMEMLF